MRLGSAWDFLMKPVRWLLLAALNGEAVHRRIWILANKVPPDRTVTDHILTKVGNIVQAKYRIATEQSAQFLLEHAPDAHAFDSPQELLARCVEIAREREGAFLEFGVYTGATINQIAGEVPDRIVHGFDSFQGLPENWRDCPEGAFSTDGKLPRVRSNVQLHVGLFQDTLPAFMKKEHAPMTIALLHIDCDLYSSTKTVFDHLGEYIGKGTVVVFDEFFNYPNFQDHEFRAWFEYIEQTNHSFEYIGFANELTALAVKIT